MAVQLLGLRTKFTDDQGRPLISGSVHTYYAGTSLPQDTFSDPELTVPNTNPVKLDDTGSADIFLKGTYRVRVFDKDGTFVEEQDNVRQPVGLSDFEQFGFEISQEVNNAKLDLEKIKEKTLVVESIADLAAIENPKDGLRVYVKSYHAGLNKGGGYFAYDNSRASENDGGTVINGWVRVNTNNYVDVTEFGVKGDGETNDTPAMQKALDYAYANALDIKLCNNINLTGGTLLIPSTNWTPVITISGGSIIKSDTGFVLSSSADNKRRDAPVLKNIKFSRGSGTGKPYVFDGNKMIRQQSYNCRFEDFCLVKSDDYIQSLRFISNTVYSQPDVFIKTGCVYDLKISSNAFETAQNPMLELHGSDTITGPYSVTNGVITENVIEGYTTVATIIVPNCSSFIITNNYFESNKYVLYQRKVASDPNKSYRMHSFKFADNYISKTRSKFDLFFEDTTSPYANTATIEGNYVGAHNPSEAGDAFTNVAYYNDTARRNLFGANVDASTSKGFRRTGKEPHGADGFSFTTANLSGGGIRATIKNLFARFAGSATSDNIAKTSYLITVSGQANSSSTTYRFNYTGILSFAVLYNGVLKNSALTLNQVDLAFSGTSGHLEGNDSKVGDVSIVFADTGAKHKLYNVNFSENQMYIDMSKVTTIDSISIVPISNIIKETDYSVMPYDARP